MKCCFLINAVHLTHQGEAIRHLVISLQFSTSPTLSHPSQEGPIPHSFISIWLIYFWLTQKNSNMNHYRFCSLIFLERKKNEFLKRMKAFSHSCPFYQHNIKSDSYFVTNTFLKVTLSYNDFYVSLSQFEKIIAILILHE